jgi:hypothetical protein
LKALAAAAALLVSVASATAARADEHEHHLGLDVGGSLLVIGNKSTNDLGGTLMAHYAYGLSDAFILMLEGAYSQVALDQTADSKTTPHTYPAWVANGNAGIGYVFDVLTWVPYAGILAGVYDLSGGTITGSKVLPGAAIAVGLDYRVTPHFTLGIAARQHMMTETKTYPTFTQLMLRAELVWGW